MRISFGMQWPQEQDKQDRLRRQDKQDKDSQPQIGFKLLHEMKNVIKRTWFKRG